MRYVAVVLIAIALLIPAAWASSNVVDFNRPHITFINPESTQVACESASRRGCTLLRTEFICNCERAGDKWTPAPHLIATPHVYTTTQEIVRHELEHISDVRSSLTEYAIGLTLRSFDSQAQCSSYISEEKKLFAATLRNIQRATTIKRDGERFANRGEGH